MKTFLTTAAIVAALTMPALAQSAGTDSRGEAQGTTKSSTSAQDGKGPNAMDSKAPAGMKTNTPGTTGAARMDKSMTGDDKGSGNSGTGGSSGASGSGGAGDGGGGSGAGGGGASK